MTNQVAGPLVSPFGTNRWEYEDSRHFYFLGSHDYRAVIGQQKHCFVLGHRGTGKTTLLKSLDWLQRTRNPFLRAAMFGDDPFSDGIVGCYIALKFVALPVFEGWLQDSSNSTRHLIIGSYLRALWLEEAASAVAGVRRHYDDQELWHEIESLVGASDRFYSWLPEHLEGETFENADPGPLTLRTVLQVAARLRDDLYAYATIEHLTPEQVIVRLRLNRLQQVTNEIFQSFSRLLATVRADRQWTFRVCMDEGEYLSERTKLTIRTLVRECESPLFIIVAALSDLGSDTLADGVSLTNDDRFVVDLDSRNVDQLRQLIDGIVGARLQQSPYSCTEFDVRELLGEFDLNDLLLLKSSENQDFARRHESWTLRLDEPDSYRNRARGWSPIRQFLEQNGSIMVVAEANDAVEARLIDSAGYRKKMVAGYLALLSECGIDRPFYGGWRVVLSSCDNSVRDLLQFLESCRSIHYWNSAKREGELSNESVCEFVQTAPLAAATQDAALDALGRDKMDGFEERVIHFTSHARRLLELFGRLSHRVDFSQDLVEPISTPECGRFVCRLPVEDIQPQSRVELSEAKAPSLEQVFLDILSETSEEGFMKLISYSPQTGDVHFRVHRSLSRFFGFSYREPQYSTSVEWEWIRRAMIRSDSHSDQTIYRRIQARRRRPEVPQGELPIDLQSGESDGLDGDDQ